MINAEYKGSLEVIIDALGISDAHKTESLRTFIPSFATIKNGCDKGGYIIMKIVPKSINGIMTREVQGITNKLIRGLTRDISPKKLAVNGNKSKEIMIWVDRSALRGVVNILAESIKMMTATKESENPGMKRDRGIMNKITNKAIATPCKLKMGLFAKSANIAIENIIAARIVGRLIPARRAYAQAITMAPVAAIL